MTAELTDAIPAFDSRLVRRATRRGLLRSALRVIVLLILAALVLSLLGSAWGSVRGRRAHFAAIVEGGFVAAHPEFEFDSGACCSVGLRLNDSDELGWSVRTAEGGQNGQSYQATFHNSVFGNISVSSSADFGDLPGPSPLGRAFASGAGPAKGASRKLLAALPTPTLFMAVIELTAPLTPAEYAARYAERIPGAEPPAPVYLTTPYKPTAGESNPGFAARPVSWPSNRLEPGTGVGGPSGRAFADWASKLRDSDNHNLRTLGLPDAKTLRALGRDPRVHAFVVQAQTRQQLEVFLDDPGVASVNIVDTAFDLGSG